MPTAGTLAYLHHLGGWCGGCRYRRQGDQRQHRYCRWQLEHVLVSFDNTSSDNFSASTLSIYVNGIAETLTESNSNDLDVDTDNASTALTIGSESDGSGGFIGQLASIKFWERALSASMVWPEVLTPIPSAVTNWRWRSSSPTVS